MPVNETRKKGQHLTLQDRHEIQRGLREHRSFREIADIIGCSADTVSKEIRNHRYHKGRLGAYIKPNRCKHRDNCRRKDVCNKKKGHKCKIPCRECLKCNELCPDFVDAPCRIETKAPYVCNNCPKSLRCLFDKYLYNADYAYKEYQEKLHESRKGIDMTRDELAALDELEEKLGSELFRELFPVILTDNGCEFADPERFERGKDGKKRTILYYCEARRSEQKGELEKNHEYIRYILPKKTSFNELTQEKVLRMINHINNTTRPKLHGSTPMKKALQTFSKNAMERLGLEIIKPDDICLKPKLLK